MNWPVKHKPSENISTNKQLLQHNDRLTMMMCLKFLAVLTHEFEQRPSNFLRALASRHLVVKSMQDCYNCVLLTIWHMLNPVSLLQTTNMQSIHTHKHTHKRFTATIYVNLC